MVNEEQDAVIIGGSFAGLSAAMQLARARRRVLVIDASKPRNRFASASHGFFGQDGRNPFEILREASRQVLAYPTSWIMQGEASTISGEKGRFSVELADGSSVAAKRIVLATGLRDELPAITGMEERWGRSVFHCPYCHGYEINRQPIGVIANHSMSAHQALLVSEWGPVTFFTQGGLLPDESEQAQMVERGIAVETTPVVRLYGEKDGLEAVGLEDGRVIELSAIFIAPTLKMASPLAEMLGCAFEEGPLGSYIKTEMQETSVPGVFAAGDAAIPMQNATMASSSGVMAGVSLHRSLVFG